jgi:hypothetical protein
MKKNLTIILFVVVLALLFHGIVSGVDESIANQDTMLCNSAKKSGNTEYLNKCACFYKGEEISCIQK